MVVPTRGGGARSIQGLRGGSSHPRPRHCPRICDGALPGAAPKLQPLAGANEGVGALHTEQDAVQSWLVCTSRGSTRPHARPPERLLGSSRARTSAFLFPSLAHRYLWCRRHTQGRCREAGVEVSRTCVGSILSLMPVRRLAQAALPCSDWQSWHRAVRTSS